VPLSAEDESALRSFIPVAILDRLAVGQTAWLAELHRITVLFIYLPGFNETSTELLSSKQSTMRALQSIIEDLEGSINKLSVDDKGVVCSSPSACRLWPTKMMPYVELKQP
jgi:hypothetical protein